MENFNCIIEKLMLNRSKLMLNRFDKELLEILLTDLEAYKSSKENSKNNNLKFRRKLVA